MLALAAEDQTAALQSAFANAILFDDVPIPAEIRKGSGSAHASRFSVYRNNVIAGLINAVGTRYPITRKLLWDDAFERIAYLYVTSEPPRSPVLLEYGESFPHFLRSIGQSSSAAYVADVAELEAARTRAYHAADATPILRDSFSALAPNELPDLRLRLHPSVQLLKSQFPVVSIWEANIGANGNSLNHWQAECALIVRPYLRIDVHRLTEGAFEFFSALKRCTFGEAIARGVAKSPKFDLMECFAVLISAEVVVALESSHPTSAGS
jgi:hypothetical protein